MSCDVVCVCVCVHVCACVCVCVCVCLSLSLCMCVSDLVEEHDGLERLGFARQQLLVHILERVARIQDVLCVFFFFSAPPCCSKLQPPRATPLPEHSSVLIFAQPPQLPSTTRNPKLQTTDPKPETPNAWCHLCLSILDALLSSLPDHHNLSMFAFRV
jgi:hypothetical protein